VIYTQRPHPSLRVEYYLAKADAALNAKDRQEYMTEARAAEFDATHVCYRDPKKPGLLWPVRGAFRGWSTPTPPDGTVYAIFTYRRKDTYIPRNNFEIKDINRLNAILSEIYV